MLVDDYDRYQFGPGDGRKFVFAVFCIGTACILARCFGWI